MSRYAPGHRFGKLVITGPLVGNANRRRWPVQCDCGTETHAAYSRLIQRAFPACDACSKKRLKVIRERKHFCECGRRMDRRSKTCLACCGKPKHPAKLEAVAGRFGVTFQAVSYHIKRRGWDGMLAFYTGTKEAKPCRSKHRRTQSGQYSECGPSLVQRNRAKSKGEPTAANAPAVPSGFRPSIG